MITKFKIFENNSEEQEEPNEYWLNEHGGRYWYKNSDITITAHRPYWWKDSVSFINEGSVYYVEDKKIWTTSDRRHIGHTTYTEFKDDEHNWTPIKNFEDYALLLKDEYHYRKYNL